MRSKGLRRVALVVCAIFVAAIFFTVALGILHAEHHCTGRHCVVCIAYWGAQFIMRIMGIAAIFKALRIFRFGESSGGFATSAPVFAAISPVSMNIRMND